MKKIRTFIPVFIMFIILATLFIFMCLPLEKKDVSAVNGTLNLDMQDDSIYTLDGEWQFYYGQLLTPREIPAYEGEPDTILVPHAWEEQGYPGTGVATYRLVVDVISDSPLTLFLPEIIGTYCLWINGEVAHSTGNVTVPETGRLYMDNALIPVNTDDGTLELVIQVSNYISFLSGLKNSLLLGENSQMLRWFIRTRGLYCMSLGGVLMAAFYHITLYIFRRREKIYLFFSWLCILCFFRFLYEIDGLFDFLGLYNSQIQLVFLFAHSASIMVFTLYIFNRGFLLLRKYWVTAYIILGSIFFYIYTTNTKAFLIINTLAIMPFFIFTIVIAAKSDVLKKDKWSRLYFIALLFYLIVGSITKTLTTSSFFMPGLINNLFIILAQSLILSKDYTRAFAFVEETNENLECIVDERTRDLQAINDAMKELIGNISHDLKTPLSVLSINLEQLGQMAQTLGDTDYQRHVNIAYHKNLDLQRLLQNLFEVSRIEAGHNMYKMKWVPLNELFADMQQKYNDFLESQNIDLIISSEKNVKLNLDSQKVWSVFDNIIYNAVRYTKAGGSISITATCDDNTARISIKDTGCGLTEEQIAHIFERFYKASPSRDTASGESGLGLYIVKNMMQGFGGNVLAESELGKGTTIHLTFVCKD